MKKGKKTLLAVQTDVRGCGSRRGVVGRLAQDVQRSRCVCVCVCVRVCVQGGGGVD